MRYRGFSLVLGAMLASGACDSNRDLVSPPRPADAAALNSATVHSSEEAGRQVARAFALAMRDSDVRAHVRNAMRASRFTEHKFVLQDFLTTKSGQRLLESAANAAEMSVPTLQALIAQLPEMDFYAPFREHRVTWKAGAAVMVGVTLQDNALSAPAYTTSGAEIEVLSFSAGNVALLLLQAAEPKSTYAASRGSGAPQVETIEDPTETATTYYTLGDPPAECNDPEAIIPCGDEGGNPGGGGSTPTMRFTMFQSNIFDGFGSAELKFIIRNEWGVEIGSARFDGVNPEPFRWFNAGVTLPRGATVQVQEIDAVFSDDFGSSPISVPGISAGYSVNCWMHYTQNGWSNTAAGIACNGWDTQVPIWAAQFQAS